MKVLVACEESQAVCKAFREKGHEAYSCDIIECSGGHPEWHIMQDVLPLLNGNCEFTTMDGAKHIIDGKWDLLIAHPPCTYLTVSGNRWFNVGKYGQKALDRERERACGGILYEIRECRLRTYCNRKSCRLYVHSLPQARPNNSALRIRTSYAEENLLVA